MTVCNPPILGVSARAVRNPIGVSGPTGPPVTIVQTGVEPEGSAPSFTHTLTNPNAAGNAILVCAAMYSSDGGANEIDAAAVNPCVDNAGNTYVALAAGEVKRPGNTWYQHAYWYLAQNIVAHASTLVTFTAQRSTFAFLTVWELTPCHFDQAVTNTGNGPGSAAYTINVGTATPASAGALAFLEVQHEGAFTSTTGDLSELAGWTRDRWDSAGGGEDLIAHQAPTGAVSFQAQGAGPPQQWSASGIILKP